MWIDTPDTPKSPIWIETNIWFILIDEVKTLINEKLVEQWVLIKNKNWKFYITYDWINQIEVNFLVIDDTIQDFKIIRDIWADPRPDIIWDNNSSSNKQTIYLSKKDGKYYIKVWVNFKIINFVEL